ncbi:DEAD/DEAH box helicase [Sphingomonas sp. GCM10030256]|uniref:DEAD/DEAH box helicase n=1 Tax=Sphingomonas sp. GCM10030256 TaxID=3273427 RepID=UPI0036125156
MKLRNWQQAALDKALTYFASADGDRHFVINAAPGSGKTRVSCAIAAALMSTGEISRVIVIAPRRTVVDQWASDWQEMTGRHMMKITRMDDIDAGQPDICATWSAVNGLKDGLQAICSKDRVLVICDEHHHAAIKAAWGASADSAFKEAAYCLILTGTPVRSDGASSVWLNLDELGAIQHPEAGMYTLTYGEAVELGYCRPVTFHRHGGLFTVDLGNSLEAQVPSNGPPVIPPNAEVDGVLRRVVDFQRLARTPQFEADGSTPQLNGYQGTMFACAAEKLDDIRLEMPTAGGLVIAPGIEMAEYFAKLIERAEGERPAIVHSNLSSTDRRINAFRASRTKRWLVSVGMVSEGVDIPRLRVLVYLPSAMTELAFRQAIGRVVRNCGHQDGSRAYVVMPALELFDEYARRIENDMPAAASIRENRSTGKKCGSCGERNDLAAQHCVTCSAEFPVRSTNFRTCECGAFNRLSEDRCNNCGLDLTAKYHIKLAAAARDGVIARGIIIPEDEVVKAEALAPAHRLMIKKAEEEHEVLAHILRTVPMELMPMFVKLVAENNTGDPGP